MSASWCQLVPSHVQVCGYGLGSEVPLAYVSKTSSPRVWSYVMTHPPAGGVDVGANCTQSVPLHCQVLLNCCPPAVGILPVPPTMMRGRGGGSEAAPPPVAAGGPVDASRGSSTVQIDPFQL